MVYDKDACKYVTASRNALFALSAPLIPNRLLILLFVVISSFLDQIIAALAPFANKFRAVSLIK